MSTQHVSHTKNSAFQLATDINWQPLHVRESEVVRPVVQELSNGGKVLVIGCPVRGRHMCITGGVVGFSPRSQQEPNYLQTRLLRVLGLSLDEVTAEANAHQRCELIFVLLVNQLIFPARQICLDHLEDELDNLDVSIVGC